MYNFWVSVASMDGTASSAADKTDSGAVDSAALIRCRYKWLRLTVL